MRRAAVEEKEFDLPKVKEAIKEICGLMNELGLTEVEIVSGKMRIVLRREIIIKSPSADSTAQPPKAKEGSEEKFTPITAPLVGTFYASASEDSKPFVEIGSEVDPETPVCIIEAMKVMNEIKAGVAGTIAEILVENQTSVEYGTPLFKVRPK